MINVDSFQLIFSVKGIDLKVEDKSYNILSENSEINEEKEIYFKITDLSINFKQQLFDAVLKTIKEYYIKKEDVFYFENQFENKYLNYYPFKDKKDSKVEDKYYFDFDEFDRKVFVGVIVYSLEQLK